MTKTIKNALELRASIEALIEDKETQEIGVRVLALLERSAQSSHQ